jgi:hypothetical protein
MIHGQKNIKLKNSVPQNFPPNLKPINKVKKEVEMGIILYLNLNFSLVTNYLYLNFKYSHTAFDIQWTFHNEPTLLSLWQSRDWSSVMRNILWIQTQINGNISLDIYPFSVHILIYITLSGSIYYFILCKISYAERHLECVRPNARFSFTEILYWSAGQTRDSLWYWYVC